MNSVDRVERALGYKSVDYVPFETARTFSDEFLKAWSILRNRAGPSKRDLDAYYGSDVAEISADGSTCPTQARTVEENSKYSILIDGFGQTVKSMKNSFSTCEVLSSALIKKSDLDKLKFDSPLLDSRYVGCIRDFNAIKDRYWIRLRTGGPFSRSVLIRGMEQFLIDMMEDPPFVRELVDRVTDHMIEIGLETHRRSAKQSSAIHIHDDLASLQSLLFSPAKFDEFLFEPYSKMCDVFHNAGLRVFYGGEGNIGEVFDRFIAAGINGFNALELRAGMDIVKLRQRYGRKVLFFGNICNTETLPSGDFKRIRSEVARQMSVAREGGCVVGPSHNIGPDITVESYECMVKAIREMGRFC
jgi:hypothetical protein